MDIPKLLKHFFDSNSRGWRSLEEIENDTCKSVQVTTYYYGRENYLVETSFKDFDDGRRLELKLETDERSHDQIWQDCYTDWELNRNLIYKKGNIIMVKYEGIVLTLVREK